MKKSITVLLLCVTLVLACKEKESILKALRKQTTLQSNGDSNFFGAGVVLSREDFWRIIELQVPRINGSDIEHLQTLLKQHGFNGIGEIDGYYGPLTESAVKTIQYYSGYEPNGKVDRQFWDFLFDQQNAVILERISAEAVESPQRILNASILQETVINRICSGFQAIIDGDYEKACDVFWHSDNQSKQSFNYGMTAANSGSIRILRAVIDEVPVKNEAGNISFKVTLYVQQDEKERTFGYVAEWPIGIYSMDFIVEMKNGVISIPEFIEEGGKFVPGLKAIYLPDQTGNSLEIIDVSKDTGFHYIFSTPAPFMHELWAILQSFDLASRKAIFWGYGSTTIPSDQYQTVQKYMFVSTTNGLASRGSPSLNSRIISSVPHGVLLKLSHRTLEKVQLNGISDYWYEIEQIQIGEINSYSPADIYTGWVFGGYLAERLEPNHFLGCWITEEYDFWIFRTDKWFYTGKKDTDIIENYGVYELDSDNNITLRYLKWDSHNGGYLEVLRKNFNVQLINPDRMFLVFGNNISKLTRNSGF